MPNLSSAQAYFNTIFAHSDPFAYLSGLPNSNPPAFEQEWLDFKSNPQPGDTLRIWSEAVCGFANTEGGVLIWGIDCRKVDDVDAASGLSLIADPIAFRSMLQNNIHQTTDPPVNGIVIQEVMQPGTAGGFVVCLIPESKHRPHRAEQAGKHKTYFMRVGDSFVVMNRSVLRQMFYPKVSADLRILAEPSKSHSSPIVRFDIEIRNDGTATATDILVDATGPFDGAFVTGDRWTNPAGQPPPGQQRFEGLSSLHPGSKRHLCSFEWKPNNFHNPMTKLFSFDVFCRDTEQRRLVIFNSQDFYYFMISKMHIDPMEAVIETE